MAGRYASALFNLAEEQQVTDAVGADLTTFAGMLEESADLRRLVRSPVFSAEEQVKALGAVLDRAGIRSLAGNFLRLVANKRRLFAISDMIVNYRKLVDHARGV